MTARLWSWSSEFGKVAGNGDKKFVTAGTIISLRISFIGNALEKEPSFGIAKWALSLSVVKGLEIASKSEGLYSPMSYIN